MRRIVGRYVRKLIRTVRTLPNNFRRERNSRPRVTARENIKCRTLKWTLIVYDSSIGKAMSNWIHLSLKLIVISNTLSCDATYDSTVIPFSLGALFPRPSSSSSASCKVELPVSLHRRRMHRVLRHFRLLRAHVCDAVEETELARESFRAGKLPRAHLRTIG